MAKNTPSVTRYKDAVVIRNTNRQISIIDRIGEGDEEGKRTNAIRFKALTSEIGPEAGVSHDLSDNGKIKYSEVRLSDDAVIDLYVALKTYLGEILSAKVRVEE